MRKAYIDLQHDIDRIRKRSEIDVANAKDFAITKFAKDMLDVYDNFDRALDSIQEIETKVKNKLDNMNEDEVKKEYSPSEILNAKVNIYEDFAEGVVMTKASLNRILNFHGVKEYNPIKEKFDPNKHEALAQYPSEDCDNGHVAGVMQTGFTIGTRVLRPAKVAVCKK